MTARCSPAAGLILVPGILSGIIAEQSGRASLQRVIGRQLSREAEHTADRLVALLSFWASWCSACREELPELIHLRARHAGDAFAIVAVNIDRREAHAVDLLKRLCEGQGERLPRPGPAVRA